MSTTQTTNGQTATKPIGSRWTFVPVLAELDASFGLRDGVVAYHQGDSRHPYVFKTDRGELLKANDRCLWPVGSIVRPSNAMRRAS